MGSLSIQQKIFSLLFLTGILVLGASILTSREQQSELAHDTINANIKLLADNYFDSINTMMLTGTMANREVLRDKLLSHVNIEQIHIIRSEQVNKIYGTGKPYQTAQTKSEQQALHGTEQLHIEENDNGRYVSYLKPIIASEDYRGTNCLGCHQANEGDILGVVKVSYSLNELEQQVNKNTWLSVIILSGIFVTAFILLGWLFRKLIVKRLIVIGRSMRLATQNNDLTLKVEDKTDDELGRLANNFNRMMDSFKTNISHVNDSSKILINSAESIYNAAETTERAIQTQKQSTDSVAAAINQLESSSAEVKNTTHFASSCSDNSEQLAQSSLVIAQQTEGSINQLANDVSAASEQVAQLQHRTLEVGKILEVISAIAEQTNLLALNAAIEAARAGEAGRGFAVVADEVRSLANKTHDSTDEIKRTIDSLQQEAVETVKTMQLSSEEANSRVTQVQQVSQALQDISAQMKEINQLNNQIADATEQQSLAAEEINQSVISISDNAQSSLEDAHSSKNVSEDLLTLAHELNEQVREFKVN